MPRIVSSVVSGRRLNTCCISSSIIARRVFSGRPLNDAVFSSAWRYSGANSLSDVM